MKFNVVLAQDSFAGTKIVTFSAEDFYAKLVMMATPNALLDGVSVAEVNPVPSIPGMYRAYLGTYLTRKLSKGSKVQIQTLRDDRTVFDEDPPQLLNLTQTIEYELGSSGGSRIFDRSVSSGYIATQQISSIHPMSRVVLSNLNLITTPARSLIKLANITTPLAQSQAVANWAVKSRSILSVLEQTQTSFGALGGVSYALSNLSWMQNIVASRVHPDNVVSTLSIVQDIAKGWVHPESVTSSLAQAQALGKVFSDDVPVTSILVFTQTAAGNRVHAEAAVSTIAFNQTVGRNVVDLESIASTPLAFNQTIQAMHAITATVTSNLVQTQTFTGGHVAQRAVSSTPLAFNQTIGLNIVDLEPVTTTTLTFSQTIQPGHVAPRAVASTPLAFTQTIGVHIIDLEAVASTPLAFNQTIGVKIVDTLRR
jgi:hypothetical protein